jgi:amidohydrolase
MDLKNIILKHADELHQEIRDIRRYLHAHPELSFQEKETSIYIRKLLDQWGIEYRFPFVNTGLLAIISGKEKEGKVVALRTDMDALPITEANEVDFTSKNPGVMHACGHDVHMATLLGAIKILSSLRDQFSGKILFIFQPAEEKAPGGAKLMMEEGLFNDLKPDMVLAQHVMPDYNSGDVGFKPGIYMASSNEIFITVKGKGGHAALPENIKDPVLMASQVLISLQEEIKKKSPKEIPSILSFGKVTADGAVNIIPNQVTIEGTFRTMNEKWRSEAHQLIRQTVERITADMGGSADIEILPGYPVLYNDPGITAQSRKFAADLLGEEHIIDMDIRMTSEDFAFFSHSYPSMMYRLGVKTASSEEIFPLHTNTFSVDESALKTGAAMMSWLALKFLTSKE